jgi:hypothetical protein
MRFTAETDDPEADARIEAALRNGPTSIWSGKTPQPGSELAISDPTPFVTLPSERRFRAAARMELDMLIAGRLGVRSLIALTSDPAASLYERVPIARALVELAKIDVASPGPRDLINFYGPNRAIKRISLFKVVGPRSDEALRELKGKVVLLGFMSVSRGTGQTDKDSYAVPVSQFPMAGTEIHANIVGNLIDRSWLKRYSKHTEVTDVLLASLLIALVGVACPLERGGPLAAVLLLLGAYLDYHAFAVMGRWIPGLPSVTLIGVMSLLVGAARHNIGVRRFRSYLKRAFGFELEQKL